MHRLWTATLTRQEWDSVLQAIGELSSDIMEQSCVEQSPRLQTRAERLSGLYSSIDKSLKPVDLNPHLPPVSEIPSLDDDCEECEDYQSHGAANCPIHGGP